MMLLALASAQSDTTDGTVYNGRRGAIDVAIPRMEAVVAVDGNLDEPVWRRAAILTGFSEFTPIDGIAAADSTEVLIWYSATALHVGIRALDASGSVRATLAQRDRISGDDNVQLFLSTFDDGRQATFLAVNPLGIQADGAVNESGGGNGCSGMTCVVSTREGPDLSQDFVWESAGRLTDDGYEVEISLPFKSIRFQSKPIQSWGINVLRVVQSRGQEQTWTAVRRGQSSFLGQSGHLTGLAKLRPGRAVDFIPTMTSRVAGGAGASGWDYQGGAPEFGGTLRWGVTPNLTMNATANPDFSQVESDAGQFAFDPRKALFFEERRPFFLDGIEQFQVPNKLIYTRRIVQPVAATKLTGKVAGTRVGVLAAIDDRVASRTGSHPIFGIMRAARDLGAGSQLGMTYTEQHDGEDANRVVGVDGRIVLGGNNSFTFNGALAHDLVARHATTAPLWGTAYRYNGRAYRSSYSIDAIDPDFKTRSGFISQPGIAKVTVGQNYTWFRPGRAMESITAGIGVDGFWAYDSLLHGGDIRDRRLQLNLNSQWRGGWAVGASVYDESFGYDPAIYAGYGVLHPGGEVTPFTGTPRIPNRDYALSIRSPAFGAGSFNLFVLHGDDENFAEWSSGRLLSINAGVTLIPTNQLRFNLTYNHTQVNRPSDGSRVTLQMVPRLRAEYQLSRDVQVRVVTQYALQVRDSLRDEGRTGLPLVTIDAATGGYTRILDSRDGRLRTDLLLTYLPNPGTVVYLGYGASHAEQDPLGRRRLVRTGDGFFLKLSYLFRK